ncbi:MAG: glycosyltransferase family 39 protein [Candidatus Doudnabacteria bacterium]|nr:glycosyltransferase family 39 protein [Candidatus Doudnabacteria bacterium]
MSSNLLKSKYNLEVLLVGLTFVLGTAMLWWVSSLGLTRALTDQNAHLNAAKLAFDSMTPGISQIGFWPPLLHILMMPFTLFNSLYQSGTAGAFVLIPALALASVFLYRLALLYTNDKFLSFVAALLLITNPYVLYYSVTPMMEILFIANLFGVAYFLALWLKEDKLVYLLVSGIFISLASLSRFEGLILIPLVGFIVLIQLVKKKKGYSEIEAVMLLFSILAIIGAVGIMIYSWIFSHNPFTFTGGSWLRNPPEATYLTKHDMLASFKYMLYASFYMLSKPLVYLSLVSFGVFALLSGKKFNSVAVLAVLFSPFVFIATTLFSGTGSIAVADLPPYDFFSNERYSLTWVGFVILTPILLISLITYYFTRSDKKWSWYTGYMLRNTMAFALVLVAGFQLYRVSYADQFSVIRRNINSPLPSQVQVINYLLKNYDYGKILITRADNDPILAQSNVPLKEYIYEGNYIYFDQTKDEPWLFARYVIMHNPEDNDAWSVANEVIMRKWGENGQFKQYYDLVLENSQRRVYKINDAKVRAMALRQHLDVSQIPSINRNIAWWDPTDIYAKIDNTNHVGAGGVSLDVKKK